jgi:hypothetical protein
MMRDQRKMSILSEIVPDFPWIARQISQPARPYARTGGAEGMAPCAKIARNAMREAGGAGRSPACFAKDVKIY